MTQVLIYFVEFLASYAYKKRRGLVAQVYIYFGFKNILCLHVFIYPEGRVAFVIVFGLKVDTHKHT